jgi:hypothetical protein
MSDELLKLPIGIQTFDHIRKNGYLYVDKTQYMVDLIKNGKVYFFSRPRRFGKSLTVSTLEALFSGKKELFKGLAAEAWLNEPCYEPGPVIHLDMSMIDTSMGMDRFNESLIFNTYAEAYVRKIELDKGLGGPDAFGQLIRKSAEQAGKEVVVLIDEYDSPYVEFFNEPEKAEEIRRAMRKYYMHLKANGQYLRFVFITGVSKFGKMGVFSTLNNLRDISLIPKYGAMCGLTHEELKYYFKPFIEKAAGELDISVDDFTGRLKDQYDGFCFDGKTYLYNMFSILLYFADEDYRMRNYWMESGSSQMIARYLAHHKLTVEQFRNLQVSKDFVSTPGEIENVSPESFLFQAGYLSLRPGVVNDYSLDYPNKEVLDSMSALLTGNILGSREEASSSRNAFFVALYNAKPDRIVSLFNQLFNSIPYDDFISAAKQSVENQMLDFTAQEWLYRSTLLAYLRGMGVLVFGELHNNKGRSDLLVFHKGKALAMELKVAYKGESPDAKLEEARAQVLERDYGGAYAEAIRLALVIGDEERQIVKWERVA